MITYRPNETLGGILYTAHGSQITPPLTVVFLAFMLAFGIVSLS